MRDYVSAFVSLDRKAIQRAYPRIPKEQLDSIKNFRAYDMEIDVTAIEIQGDRASVDCRIAAHLISFAGKEHQLPQRKDRMVFRYRDGVWVREE